MRKKRVQWNNEELLQVQKFVDEHPNWPPFLAISKAQETLFPINRHVGVSTIWNGLRTGSFYRQVQQAKAAVKEEPPPKQEQLLHIEFVGEEPIEESPPKIDVDAIAEKVAALVLPSLVDVVRDMVMSDRITRMVATIADVEEVLKKDPTITTRTTPRRRIDVLGLLPSQVEVVKTYLGPRDDLKLRFILSEHASKVDRYAPDVIMCTGFVSHSHQDMVRKSGSRLHYANGAAASVTNILSGLIQ